MSSKSKAKAAAKLETLRAGDLPRPRQTVGDVLDWWTEEHLQQRLAAGAITRRTAKGYIGQTVHLEGLRGVRLADLDATVVDRHLAHLAQSFAPRTVQYTRAVLRIAMRSAAAKTIVPMAAAEAVMLSEPVEVVPGEVPILTPDMADKVLAVLVGDRLRPLYLTMLGLGLRFGEALALSWSDVDLDARTPRIRHSLGRVDGEWVLGDTKQHADVTLALPAVVVAALREQRRIQAEERLRTELRLLIRRLYEAGLGEEPEQLADLDDADVARLSVDRLAARLVPTKSNLTDTHRHILDTYLGVTGDTGQDWPTIRRTAEITTAEVDTITEQLERARKRWAEYRPDLVIVRDTLAEWLATREGVATGAEAAAMLWHGVVRWPTSPPAAAVPVPSSAPAWRPRRGSASLGSGAFASASSCSSLWTGPQACTGAAPSTGPRTPWSRPPPPWVRKPTGWSPRAPSSPPPRSCNPCAASTGRPCPTAWRSTTPGWSSWRLPRRPPPRCPQEVSCTPAACRQSTPPGPAVWRCSAGEG